MKSLFYSSLGLILIKTWLRKAWYLLKMTNIINTSVTLAYLSWIIAHFVVSYRFTLDWKRYWSPKRSCEPKVLLIFGRIRDRMCAFGLVKGGTFWIILIILFHELIASGEKVFLYLEVLRLISWMILELKKSLYKGLRFGGSLSLSRKKSSCF